MNLLKMLLPDIFRLGDKLIEDKDKKAEYAFEVQKMSSGFMSTMLTTKTYPWVDALVKIAYASEAIIKGLFRPVLSAVLVGFGIYFELNNIEISATVETIMFGSPVAWGASRHIEKKAKLNKIEEDEEW